MPDGSTHIVQVTRTTDEDETVLDSQFAQSIDDAVEKAKEKVVDVHTGEYD